MLNAGALAFREFMVREPLPLSTIQDAVLEYLRDRDDVVLFGAHAVNAYVGEPRMTQDIDVVTSRAREFAEELREHLGQRFGIAVRVREVREGRGYRLFQVRKSGNRHLVDVRFVGELPSARRIEGVSVMAPVELIASKVLAFHQRRGAPKSGTDWRDLAMLLLAFPDLKDDPAPVTKRLQETGADPAVLAVWTELAAQEIRLDADEDEF